jgi:hypothetical protein
MMTTDYALMAVVRRGNGFMLEDNFRLTHENAPHYVWPKALEEGTEAFLPRNTYDAAYGVGIYKSLGWYFSAVCTHTD